MWTRGGAGWRSGRPPPTGPWEDRALALMDAVAGRRVPAINDAVLEAALATAPALGEDQAAAVKVLAGEGGGLRAVLAPAGYGKTTMLHAAAQAAASDGRPVVAELAGAGLDSRTVARLRLDLAHGPLAAGTVALVTDHPTCRSSSAFRVYRGRFPLQLAHARHSARSP